MRIHLCCGSIYLDGYVNCDVIGDHASMVKNNKNKTTLDKYFKFPFEKDKKRRIRRPFIIDVKMNPLEFPWCFESKIVEEVIMVSAFEHFEHETEIPFIIKEIYRILKIGGIFKFDFPDIKKQVDEYYGKDDEFLMELIYCNHKNKHSQHLWGYTEKTIDKYLTEDKWKLEMKQVVEHSYPMIGCWATKK